MMTGVPTFTVEEARRIAEQHYGRRGTITELPSERDQNFLLVGDDGERFVLKVANANEHRAVLEGENHVMRRVEASRVCPWIVRTRDGHDIAMAGQHHVRLVTALDGQTFGGTAWQTDDLRRDIGRTLGRFDEAMAGCDHPAFHRHFHWDLAHALDVVDTNLALVADDRMRALIRACAERHRSTVAPALQGFRRSLIHSDANDYNVLVDPARQRVTGIIDFGDMVFSHTVNNVAIAMAYATLGADDPLRAAAAVVEGYHEAHPLTPDEIAAVFSLMCMRLCVSACVAAAQQAARPDAAYLGISQGPIGVTLPLLSAIHPRFAHYTFRAACGLDPVPHAPRIVAWLKAHADAIAPLTGHDLRVAPVAPIDLGVGSPLLSGDPATNTPAEVDRRVRRVIAEHGAVLGAGGYDEARVMYAWDGEPTAGERRTIHIGLDLSLPPGSPLHAPLDGVVHGVEHADAHHDYGPVVVLRHETTGDDSSEFFTLYGHLTLDSIASLRIGQRIAKGHGFARVGSPPDNGDWWPHVHVQVITDMLDVPCNVDGVVRPSQRAVWRSLCPDPNLLLGIPADRLPQHRSRASIAAARAAHTGRNLGVSYDADPLNARRGWMQYLFDGEGRRYIDAYNNVAHVGHAHPRVVRAVSEQLSVLNTNTRYLQEPFVAYAEALVATFPEPLRVCFFTASGSEANELALRLARAHTGQRDLIVMDAAYHGHTTTLIDISPYKHAGPGGSGAPDWVHTSPIPDTYRVRDVSGDPGAWFAARVGEVIDRVRADGRGLCGYIAETCPSVGGQIMLPDGFLRDVYARVRGAGGVCIADEVQTGFGRIGTHFWAFEAHGVVPDIVVLGKPIANGFPMGAVVTTRAIADRFANGMEFFSTFGGSTAACVAAMATLRVTQDEGLQRNALVVGERLLAGLRLLAAEHPLVGDVRGSGLFLGVELVRDRETRVPAAGEARWVVNRMRALGVLAGTDGRYHNVIKLRGPMSLSLADADRVVALLSQSLRELP